MADRKRRKNMKKWTGMILAGLCTALLAGCGGAPAATQDKGAVSSEKVLKVGTDADFPPFEYFQKETKTYTGFDVELVQDVAKNMGYDKVEFVDTDIRTILDDLDAGKFDVAMRCLAITDARKEKAAFTDPYLTGGYAVVAPASYSGSSDAILKDRKLAVEKGSAPERLLRRMGYDNLKLTATNEDALRRVESGAADLAVMSKFTAAFYDANGHGEKVKVLPGLEVGEAQPIGFAVRKQDEDFLKKLDAALDDYKRTTNYEQLKKSYFGNLL